LTANQSAKLGAAVGVAGMLFGLHGGGVAGKAPPLALAVPSVGRSMMKNQRVTPVARR
jgi:hypothetical protein